LGHFVHGRMIPAEADFIMYNVVEVSGHNLESSQTRGSCMDFLNHRKGGMVFFLKSKEENS
jgi:hypothetical protein